MAVTECSVAEPQAPRDVSADSVGTLEPKVRALTVEEVAKLVHVNTHFHEGAEHFSSGEYCLPGAGVNLGNVTAGYSCSTSALTANQLKPYSFHHCRNVEVGRTYEFHWVFSSGGVAVADGLAGAFARTANSEVAVQAQVYVIVNDEAAPSLLERSWNAELATSAVRYIGSTTGTDYDDEVCSPYSVSWHVDTKCQRLSASAFDAMCATMASRYAMDRDLDPHGSRALVLPRLASSRLDSLTALASSDAAAGGSAGIGSGTRVAFMVGLAGGAVITLLLAFLAAAWRHSSRGADGPLIGDIAMSRTRARPGGSHDPSHQ